MKTENNISIGGAATTHIGNIHIEKMPSSGNTPLSINYQIAQTALGKILIASTDKGICHAGFIGIDDSTGGQNSILCDSNIDEPANAALTDLQRRFPKSTLTPQQDRWQQEALAKFNNPEKEDLPLHLHLKGTDFQLSIWEKLLRIPYGALTTYSALGGGPRNARATGSAVGDNPVCYLIPCHRVIRTDGRFEGYFWGTERKKILLAREASLTSATKPSSATIRKIATTAAQQD